MKKIVFLILAATAALTAASCADEEMNTPASEGYGRIQLRSSADVAIETRAAVDVSTLGVTVPEAGDFALTLTSDDPVVNSIWASVDTFNQADTLFKAGTYTASVTWGDPDGEGENKPYYAGTQTFPIVAGQTVNKEVTAQIANAMAEVRATEAFLRYFHDATFTLTTGSGHSFPFTPGAEPADKPVFVKAGTSISVSGKARRQSQTGTDNGTEITLAAQPLAATTARTRHIFTFDAANAGSATLTITLAEGGVTITPVEIELNDNAE